MALSEQDVEEGMMSRRAAAAFMGCHVNTVDRMILDGELEAVRIRNAVRISRAACVDALNRTSSRSKARPGRPRKGAA